MCSLSPRRKVTTQKYKKGKTFYLCMYVLQVFVFTLASERAGGQLGLMLCQGVSPGAYFVGTYLW